MTNVPPRRRNRPPDVDFAVRFLTNRRPRAYHGGDEPPPEIEPMPPHPVRPDRRLVRCAACARTEVVGTADLTGYARGGWPRCCGQVMAYLSESEAELAPETPLETPSLRTTASIPGQSSRVPLSILVVDDHEDTATSQAAILTAGGFTVRVAMNGPEAVAAAAEMNPDVILLDIVMPQMSGWDVAKTVRAGLHQPLIVAVSGQGTDPDRAESAAAGIDLYLVKPVGPAFLLGLINSVVPAATR